MGMTMTEKILAAHAGLESVKPGQLIKAKPDLCMAHDASGPIAMNYFKDAGFDSAKYPEKVIFVMDHFTPAKDIKTAENCRQIKEFCRQYGLRFIDGCLSKTGITHALLPEQGWVATGDLVIGGDSHTVTYGALGAVSSGIGCSDIACFIATGEAWFKVPPTIRVNLTGELKPWVTGKDVMLHLINKISVSGALYKALEFGGPGLKNLSMDSRFTIANMAIEAGGKNGIFEVDDITLEYEKGRADHKLRVYKPDPDAVYEQVIDLDLGEVELMVALPHLPENGVPVKNAPKVKMDEIFIGSCTNGRISDLAMAAKVLKGHRVAEDLRVLIVPATPTIYKEMVKLGYMETFLDAGCVISPPTCAACGGGHMGMMGKGEKVLTTTNRNYRGRMGHIDSEIYLCSPATAAASAITGYITSPEEIDLM